MSSSSAAQRRKRSRRPRARNAEPQRRGRRFASIAWSIGWGFWWRRLMGWLIVDVLVVASVVLVLLRSYAGALPASSLTPQLLPAEGVTLSLSGSRALADLPQLELVVERDSRTLDTFPIGRDVCAAWPVALALGVMQLGSALGFFSDVRRVRRRMQPLNELALKAEEIGAMGISSAGKIESLEQAIERASVDSPRISTGDQDLMSIEVALNTLLRQMNEAKVQQMRFVSDASHELRTPIAVIQGYVNMLDRWGKDDRSVLEESIAALKAESEHMQGLVEQLLFLARGDSGRNALQRTRVNMAAVVAGVWEESMMIDPEHAYVLGFDEQPAIADQRLELTADAAMLKQSLRIIVQNAAKYSTAGSEIKLDVRFDGSTVSYIVQDSGIGMSDEDARHAFERFYRADAARGTGEGGSGLGLSIAKWIVDAHAGSIDLLSREGVGTRFTVTLPRG